MAKNTSVLSYEQDLKADTLIGALATVWSRSPERVALVHGRDILTYAQLGRAIMKLAGAYYQLGIRPGDRVVCSVSNRPEQIMAMGAAWACGAVHVGVDYQFTASELSSILDLTQASVFVIESTEEPRGVHIRTLQGGLLSSPEFTVQKIVDSTAEQDEQEMLSPSSAQDPAFIFISSGTTGKPKATVGYQGNLCQRWQRLAGWLRFGADDVHLAQLPLSHGFGLMMAMAALLTGGQLVLVNDFSAEEILRMISTNGITILNGAPAHFKLVLNRLDRERHDVHTLRFSVGTAAMFPPSLIQAICDQLGVDFMFMYGSSEGVGVATTNREDMLLGSVGRPTPGSVSIVGSDRKPLPTGAVGEIAFSRKVYPVRYYTKPGSEAPQEPNGSEDWYYSGDLGRLDEQGRLYVLGRLKHQIDRGGLKIDPVEVESALLRCPEVADAIVIGRPNPILGESVCACVVPAVASAPSLEHLRTILSRELASYKLPEELYIVDHIPRTQIGKVDFEKLRANIADVPVQTLRNA